jgi:hypothetical protein
MASRRILPTLAAASLLCCSAQTPPPDFLPLFDGRTLDAFTVDTPGLWSVKDGVIAGRHAGLKYNDFLRTKVLYSNFVLRAKFRLHGNAGNSGIQFRSRPADREHEVSGYQADIGQQYWGALYDESRRNRVLASPAPAALEGLDRTGWNEYTITANGPRITLQLNGRTTVDYTETEPGIAPTGFLALQVHSGPGITVEFKDLYIKELPATPLGYAERYGPFLGDVIPAFSAQDQNGKTQSLASIAGPNGAALLFFRSADW